MKGSLLVREILPFYASLVLLLGAALLLDAVLHLADAVWIGRWLGIPGVLLILGSFGHSLRKRTTTGLPIKHARPIPPFHQALTEKNCLACHSDHPAPRLTEESPKTFDHALLAPATRGQCQACHRAPQDTQRHGLNLPCAQCHQPAGLKPATFDHSRYSCSTAITGWLRSLSSQRERRARRRRRAKRSSPSSCPRERNQSRMNRRQRRRSPSDLRHSCYKIPDQTVKALPDAQSRHRQGLARSGSR